MKRIAFLLTFMTGWIAASAQHYTQKDLEAGKASIMQLDSMYKNVLDPDPGQKLFRGKGALYYDAHEKLLADLAAHLKKNNFTWGAVVKTIARIYYTSDGRIDHFICDVKKGGLAADKAETFDRLLRDFIAAYSTGVSASQNFYHRSPVTFKD